MYLAQYEAETQIPGENRQVTLFIQAASNDVSTLSLSLSLPFRQHLITTSKSNE
jgi:hypothetical protein